MPYQKKTKKTRKNKKSKHKNYHRYKKFSKRAGVLNRPTFLMQLETKHEEDGDVASADVLRHLEGLPQNLPDEEHGLGAARRMEWLKNNDFEALLQDMKDKGIDRAYRREQFKTPSLSRSNRQRYLNEIATQRGLEPGGEWHIVKRKKTRSKKR